MARATFPSSRFTSTLGATTTLVRHRARRDAGLLATLATLVALASLLVGVAPGLVTSSVDEGSRQAIADLGHRADMLVHSFVGDPEGTISATSPVDFVGVTERVQANLPPGLAVTAKETVGSAISPKINATVESPPRGVDAVAVRIAMVTDAASRISLVAGELPPAAASSDPDAPVAVLLSRKSAEQAELEVGDRFSLPDFPPLEIVGLIEPTQPTESAVGEPLGPWLDVAEAWESRRIVSQGQVELRMTVLTSPTEFARVQNFSATPWSSIIRVSLAPSSFTDQLRAQVIEEIKFLTSHGNSLVPETYSTVRVSSGLRDGLESFSAQARAAVAQMSLLLAGALGVALCAVLLIGRLFVLRRAAEVRLERARGASLPSIAIRVGVETIAASAVGAMVAMTIMRFPAEFTSVALVATLAAVAPIAQTVVLARASWSGRQVPANRDDRLDVAKARRSRRLIAEATVIVLAVAALWTTRSRGLLQSRSDGIDPLLSVAPLLLALAVCVIVLRVQPVVTRAIGRAAARGRGALGLLGAAHARTALTVLPLMALTLAISLAVSGALLVDTVRAGQEQAGLERVGADARVDGEITGADVSRVLEFPGVTAAATFTVDGRSTITHEGSETVATVLGVDRRYPELVAALPDQPDTAILAELAGPVSGDRVPVIVDALLASRLESDDVTIDFRDDEIAARVVGTFDSGPSGYLDGPFLYVDLELLSARTAEPLGAETLLVVGPEAEASVAGITGELSTRAGWVADRRSQGLITGVNQLMTLSVAAAALFALVGLLASVVAGARSRGRNLALLRTLGFRRRVGRWLLASEIAPVVVASLIGGVAAGVGIVIVLGPALGLWSLAGGVEPPALSVSPGIVAIIVLATLLASATSAVVEELAHRRDRLSDVLRVGDAL